MGSRRVFALTLLACAGSCEQPTDPFLFARNPINGVALYLPLYQVVQVGEVIRVDAEGFYNGNGVGTEYPRTVSFVSSDTNIVRLQPATWTASFIPTVRATGLKPGLVTVTATINGVATSDTLRVIPEIASITLTPASASFFVGDTVTVAVDIRSTAGQPITERRPLITWDTPGILISASTLTSNRVVGRTPGTTVLKAFIGPDTGRVTVTVKARAP